MKPELLVLNASYYFTVSYNICFPIMSKFHLNPIKIHLKWGGGMKENLFYKILILPFIIEKSNINPIYRQNT